MGSGRQSIEVNKPTENINKLNYHTPIFVSISFPNRQHIEGQGMSFPGGIMNVGEGATSYVLPSLLLASSDRQLIQLLLGLHMSTHY